MNSLIYSLSCRVHTFEWFKEWPIIKPSAFISQLESTMLFRHTGGQWKQNQYFCKQTSPSKFKCIYPVYLYILVLFQTIHSTLYFRTNSLEILIKTFKIPSSQVKSKKCFLNFNWRKVPKVYKITLGDACLFGMPVDK